MYSFFKKKLMRQAFNATQNLLDNTDGYVEFTSKEIKEIEDNLILYGGTIILMKLKISILILILLSLLILEGGSYFYNVLYVIMIVSFIVLAVLYLQRAMAEKKVKNIVKAAYIRMLLS